MAGNHIINLKAGDTFNYLTVISDKVIMKGEKRCYECRCKCGAVRVVIATLLTNGRTKSCGCIKAVTSKLYHFRSHGHSKSPTYISWRQMLARCLNPNSDSYPYYGGRGIEICDRWQESFENFLADMGERPPGMTLDRKNNNGDYEPGNCRWATPKQQNRNTKANRIITWRGRSQTLVEWSEEFDVPAGSLSGRIANKGVNETFHRITTGKNWKRGFVLAEEER